MSSLRLRLLIRAAPTVVSVAPPIDGSTDVATTSSVNAVFDDEASMARRVTGTTFELRDSGVPWYPLEVSYTAVSRTRCSSHQAYRLHRLQTYTATLRGGTNGVRDVAGNAMAADYSWSFTTSADQEYYRLGIPARCHPCRAKTTQTLWNSVSSSRSMRQAPLPAFVFTKGLGNTGTHVGNLWTSSGQLLASAQFVDETSSGWQQVIFGAPVLVSPGSVYVASYHAPNGNYAASSGYFSNSGVDAGPVNLLQDGVSGGNGVYAYSSDEYVPDLVLERQQLLGRRHLLDRYDGQRSPDGYERTAGRRKLRRQRDV